MRIDAITAHVRFRYQGCRMYPGFGSAYISLGGCECRSSCTVMDAGSRLAGPLEYARAFEMFALGKPISTAQALDWGIGNRVVPVTGLHGEAHQQAAGSLKTTKQLMKQSAAVTAQVNLESAQFAERLRSPEARGNHCLTSRSPPPDTKLRSKI